MNGVTSHLFPHVTGMFVWKGKDLRGVDVNVTSKSSISFTVTSSSPTSGSSFRPGIPQWKSVLPLIDGELWQKDLDGVENASSLATECIGLPV